ncbi:hypothetical protein DBR45_12270 [Pseudomonas sp. HMWF031]|nr:hypothetical protein DBR45_12270 [Pseudomonas sp. HMWF031]
MYDDRKGNALAGWRALLGQLELRVTVEEQYDELLKMADAMQEEGLISGLEWRQLIRDAGGMFSREELVSGI